MEGTTMTRRTLHTSDEEGFLRAYWDSLADIEVVYGLRCKMLVTPTERKGVLRFRLSAVSLAGTPLERDQAVFTSDYPTVQVGTLAAFLYRSALKLEHILEMQRRYPEGKA